jgi:DNA-binding response OmpR family regulator
MNTERSNQVAGNSATGARILIVDDSPANRDLLSTLLKEQAFVTTTAGSVAEARKLLETMPEPFDLILSDVNMPGENGFDLIRWAKGQASHVADLPILFITSELPEPEHRIHGLALGAADYVSRSLELDELVLRVGNAIENHRKVKNLKASLEDSESKALAVRLLAASNHEVKNLAQLVCVSSDLVDRLVRRSSPDENVLRALETLSRSSGLLVEISRNIATLMSSHAPEPGPMAVDQVIEEIVAMLGPRAKPAQILSDGSSGGCWALGHTTSVKQIMVNLVLNAIESVEEMAPAGGGQIKIGATSDDHWTTISVSDNGIGFTKKEIRQDFEAFSSTKHLRGGQGLGLWLCARLARNMGGHLELASDGPGTGAAARLKLRNTSRRPEKMDLSRWL